ncbi:hypothetical protein K450DRAFT_198594 [Umbelopsis ramanniana AG]|uniref:Actin cytoskeleton-regulatory complex protein SLA1 n=1 Tax=Umbelopsis ramanniana AG TaxID=1314678 RepID=A0AAD5HFA5_UMBRA|nr:uncharacterized protein K450DRAFT_198594 [Umbelopsis ramanniana AG]KAI8580486.1 hypothetical protein K450DRAFT_198594 [Umbelopsis ramanniana AG]
MKYVAVCKALYDYDAQAAEEVSIKEDDILYVIDNSDPSWLEVQLKMPSVDQIGPIGLVPASYVEEVQPIGTVTAEYAYEAQQDEEVSFEEDEEMTLYDKDDADWYLVKVKSGEIGLAPSNYIRQADTHEESQPTPIARPQELSPSPPPLPSTETPTLNDEPKTWSVHEYNPEKKKRKKAKGTLTVGNGMITYENDTDKTAPKQQYHVLDISKYLLDTKNVHIEIISSQPIVFDFQAASKSEAKGILVKITDSRNAAAKFENKQMPASPARAASIDPIESTPQSPNCEPKWGIVLFSFEADGGNELSVREHDQVLITDYVSSEEWWHVELSDQRSGIVPSSYLQFHEDYEAALAKEERQKKEEKRQKEASQRKADDERRRKEEEQRRADEERRRVEQEQKRRQEEAARQAEEANRRQKQEEERKRQLEQKKQAERAAMYQDLPKPDPSQVRLWTDRTGAFKVEAQFVSASDGKYRLHKTNGVKIDVPEDKLCVEDVEYVRDFLDREEQQKRKQKASQDAAKSTAGPSKATSAPQKSYNQDWDWFDWFMMLGIPMQQSLVYSSSFKSEKLDDSDIPKLTHKQMKTLGMKEKYVQRVQRFIENEKVEPPSDEETANENDEDQDEALARKIHEAENEGKAPNIFRKKSKSSEGNASARPKATSPAPAKVHGDIFDLLTGEPVEEEPKPVSPKATGDSASKQLTSPTSPQDGFDDDAWIPRTVQAIKTGTYKSKASTNVAPQNTASRMEANTMPQQQNGLQQAPVQAVNMSGQSQQYQQQPVAMSIQQQPSGFQQPPVQATNPTGQSTGSYQQSSAPLQQQQSGFQQPAINQSYTGYQQYPNQGNSMAPQQTGVQQPIPQAPPIQYVPQQLTDMSMKQQQMPVQQQQMPMQQQQMPAQTQFVPQQMTNTQYQQPSGIPMQPQFTSQSIPNAQYQQQQMTAQQQYVPQQATGMQFQQQQQPASFYSQQPVQQNFVQPIQTTTVPLSNILPAPLVPSSSTFNGQLPQMTGQGFNGGMQQQHSNFQGIQPQATGNRNWQSATADNPFGSPTPSPLVPQMTGMQFSTPSPDTFVGNHASAIRPQYTGMSTQQSGFGNNFDLY